MPWIFGSFLVTPCALASCPILIGKQQRDQGTRVQQVFNRKETTWTSRSDFDRMQRIVVERGTRSWPEASLTGLEGGASVSTPWLLGEDMGRRNPLSEYMSPPISHTPQKHQPFREIYFYKEVCSFVHWSCKSSLCFRLYMYVTIQHKNLENQVRLKVWIPGPYFKL